MQHKPGSPRGSCGHCAQGCFSEAMWLGGKGQDHERQEEMSTAGLVSRPEQSPPASSSCQGAMGGPQQQDKDKVRGSLCFHAPLGVNI